MLDLKVILLKSLQPSSHLALRVLKLRSHVRDAWSVRTRKRLPCRYGLKCRTAPRTTFPWSAGNTWQGSAAARPGGREVHEYPLHHPLERSRCVA